MAKTNDLFEIDGFGELNRKLKRLDDKVTRREVLKIQRQLAKPIIKAYAGALPKRSGTLAKSVKAVTVPARKVGGNPSVVVRPGKKGKNDGYYKFMVIRKGAKPGSRERGSRKGMNTVTEEARDEAVSVAGTQARKEAVDKTAKYVQKQIDRLSK